LFLVATARVEEAENLRFFGEEYQEYMKRTKMFVPYLL
jgi:protein-S-isoprenylcysteine O-methyltransferase Ste14